jgi:hypothetical protein
MKKPRRAARLFIPSIALLILVSFVSCFDAQRDNVNDPSCSDYKITASVTPSTNSVTSANDDIVILFTDPMNRASAISGLTGTMTFSNAQYSWSSTYYIDDTLTISVNTGSLWTAGSGHTLTVYGTTAAGVPITPITATYTVENRVYVSTAGDDAPNIGNRTRPFLTIKAAITKAQSLYGATASKVCVATGTYAVNWASNTNRIVMVAGISLYGGYNADFSNRNSTAYPTTITDGSTSGGTTWANPNRAIDCSSLSITSATVIDGFTINGGGSDANKYAAAIFCYSGASPTIQNNSINGYTSTGNHGNTYGIINSSSPIIQNNTITGGNGNVSLGRYNGDSYAIYSDFQTGQTQSPTINNNTIVGGYGYDSYGILISSGAAPVITKNSISGGEANQISYGIWLYTSTSCSVFNNLIFGGRGYYQTYGIYTGSAPTKIYNNTIDGGRSLDPSPNNLYCVFIADTTLPLINNNILLFTDTSSSSSKRFGIYEGVALTLTSLKNNNISPSCTGALYYNFGAVPPEKTNISDINGWGGGYSGNSSTAPSFVSYSSSVAWASADLHLTAADTGGLDGSPSGLNWGFTNDKDNVTRTGNGTTGWSMGAYERD